MNVQLWPKEEIHLHPGEVFCSQQKAVIKTLLGSCVAVCFWDDKLKLGGMNHIMLPLCRENNVPSTRYANVATFVLLDMMLNNGAKKGRLTARIFGGACRMKSEPNSDLYVGDRNVDVTTRVLRKLGIPIVSSDTGGKLGRKIQFDQFTGKIKLSYIQNYSFRSEAVQITRGERRNELW